MQYIRQSNFYKNSPYLKQKVAWVLEHQHDLETLSVEKLNEKYNIGRHVVKAYKKHLIGLKQNENE